MPMFIPELDVDLIQSFAQQVHPLALLDHHHLALLVLVNLDLDGLESGLVFFLFLAERFL